MEIVHYITLSELARLTRLPTRWLRRETEAGRIPCLRAGRRLMFDPAAVRDALAEMSTRPISPSGGREEAPAGADTRERDRRRGGAA